jgi:hypothetical protein
MLNGAATASSPRAKIRKAVPQVISLYAAEA